MVSTHFWGKRNGPLLAFGADDANELINDAFIAYFGAVDAGCGQQRVAGSVKPGYRVGGEHWAGVGEFNRRFLALHQAKDSG